jgi:glycerol-3-phosphate cytidylyltransferase-like family protein
MAKESPPPPSERKRGRFWLNVGESAAVLAVVIAGLSYWDSHKQHVEADRQAAETAKVHSAIVLRGEAEADGRRIALDAVGSGQVIQTQRYIFPTAVLDHPMEVSAAKPQIDLDWIAHGLDQSLDATHAKKEGEARVPVAVVTTYVEDGDSRIDHSVYQLGYRWRSRFLGGRQIVLQGIALERRGVIGDLRTVVDRRWAAQSSGAGPT